MSFQPRYFSLPVIASCLLGGWEVANANAWKTQYGANLEFGHTDNFRLTESETIETSLTELDVFTNLSSVSEISQLSIKLGAGAIEYSDSSIDANSRQNLALTASRNGERWTGVIDLSLASEAIAEIELADTGNLSDGNRDDLALTSNLIYAASDRISYSISLSARDVRYDGSSFTEFRDGSILFGWQYQLDEVSDIEISANRSQFRPDDDSNTDIIAVRLAYNWRAYESTSYNFALGYNDVDRPRDSETGADYSAGVNYRVNERNNLIASFKNSYSASGAGEVRNEDDLSIRWTYTQSAKTRYYLILDALRNDDRDFAAIELGTNYQYSREIDFGARLRHQQQTTNMEDADANSVFISLSYAPI